MKINSIDTYNGLQSAKKEAKMYKTDEQRITEFYENLDTSQSEGQEIDMQDEEFDWDEDFGAYEASKAELDKLLEEEEE